MIINIANPTYSYNYPNYTTHKDKPGVNPAAPEKSEKIPPGLLRALTFGAAAKGKKKKNRSFDHNGLKFIPDGNATKDKGTIFKELMLPLLSHRLEQEDLDTLAKLYIKHESVSFALLKPLVEKLTNVGQHYNNLFCESDNAQKIFCLADDIRENEEYKRYIKKDPLIYNSKVYIADGQSSEEKKEFYKEIFEPVIKEYLEENDAEFFRRFFIQQEKMNFKETDKLYLSLLFSGDDHSSKQSERILGFLSKEMAASDSYKKNRKLSDQYYCTRQIEIEQLEKEGDINKYYEFIDKDDRIDVENFNYYLNDRTQKETGVNITSVDEGLTGLKFKIELYELLKLYKDLGVPLPDRVSIIRPGSLSDPYVDHRFGGDYCPCFIQNNKLTFSKIRINGRYFTEEGREKSKDPISEAFWSFNHELGHHIDLVNRLENGQTIKGFEEGLERILDEGEKAIFNSFKENFDKHYTTFSDLYPEDTPPQDWLDTSKPHNKDSSDHLFGFYNIAMLGANFLNFKELLEKTSPSDEDIKNDFNLEFMDKLTPVMEKLINAASLIRQELRPYASCNPCETIAVASEVELGGEALSPELRELTKEMGKTGPPTFTYVEEKKDDSGRPKFSPDF